MGINTEKQAFESLPRQVARRHWLLFLCGQSAGILTALQWPGKGLFFALLALAIGGCIYAYPRLLTHRQTLVWALFFFAFGNLLVVAHGLPRKPDALHQLALSYPYGPLCFEGVVSETKPLCEGSSYSSFVLHIDTVIQGEERRPLSGKAQVGWSDPLHPLFHGSRIRIKGRLSPHLSTVNHGISDRELQRRSQGIFSSIRCFGRDLELLAEPRFSLPYWTSRLRQNQAEHLAKAVPSRAFPLVLGVWLGDRSLITDETYDTFSFSGTAHVLAVSGLHVGIIVLSFPFLCMLLRVPKRYTLPGSMAGVIVFAFMTGAHISVIRSTLMVLLYQIYQLFRREPDTVSVLSLSGVAFLTVQPEVIREIAFLLSFGSVASILLFYPGIVSYLKKLPRFLSSTLAVTLASQLVTLPLVAWYFFNVSITAVLANLLVVPL
ncbi:MAG: ComEC/Rec2 family competence protein, partial [Candidatus Hydrogenedens sp.]|nr:ComEC/Rec2 family competence protein [Candidatus Hydrogenedens sp.]